MDFWRVRAGSGLVTAAAAVAVRRASSAARNVERGSSRRGELVSHRIVDVRGMALMGLVAVPYLAEDVVVVDEEESFSDEN